MPLRPQFERVRQVADALNIPIFEMDGFEADDILGTLSSQADELEIPTTIVTAALAVGLRARTRPDSFSGASETVDYDPEAVRRRYDLEPGQLPDWKALVGDKSDNIPGVPGIGAKAASEMLDIRDAGGDIRPPR